MSNKNVPLPPELSRFSNFPDLKYVTNGEWSAGHPGCTAPASTSRTSDRLRLFAANGTTGARVWCRRCGWLAFADELDDSNRHRPNPVHEAERRQRLADEAARMEARIKELQESAYWRGFHDGMTEAHRQLWQKEGIGQQLQDRFMLGYTKNQQYVYGGESYVSPALTIPVFGVGWTPINVQYKLLAAPPEHGKYRYTSGLGSSLYLSDPDVAPGGRCLLVEGAKKCIITYERLVLGAQMFDYVVAVPGLTPKLELLDQLCACDEVVVALDPDAWVPGNRHALRRIAKYMREHEMRGNFIQLPAKPDDFFTQYHGTPEQFAAYVEQGDRI